MAEIICIGNAKFEVIERSDTNLKLRSLYSGMIRDADPLYTHLGYCTRKEYLCNVLLNEPLRGYSDNFTVVPVKLWWYNIIDVCVNSKFILRISTKENWQEMLRVLDMIQKQLDEPLTEVEQRLQDLWYLRYGYSEFEFKPYTMLSNYKGSLVEALKCKDAFRTVRLQILSEHVKRYENISVRLLQTEGTIHIVRINSKVMRMTIHEYERLLRFLKYCPYVKTFDGDNIRYFDEEDCSKEVYEIINV